MIKCVVPISGGKDSQACLKLALNEFQPHEILGLFCDTKFEHEWTYDHASKIENLYGVEVRYICGGSVEEKVRRYKRFPGGAQDTVPMN
jgi:3'-phosphoadenosine 5'-phosphosulfate sulfotransferase (PAPS reductase)/FAD synthetase